MEVKVINQFIIAFHEVLESIGLETKRAKNLSLTKEIIDAKGALVLIEILGKFEGKCFITLTRDDLLSIASEMNMEEFTEINDMVLSTLCEIGNMAFGRAISLLGKHKYMCDITTPIVFSGSELVIETKRYNYITVPFETNVGKLILCVSIEKK